MKKTVFISSTYRDLAEHRRAVWSVLETFDVTVRGMEQFGARTEGPLETCLAEVEQSDVYVGIVAFRIGSMDKASGKSFTQLEYELAVERDRDALIYLIDEDEAEVRFANIDLDHADQERLRSFKKLLRDRHTVDTFTTPVDLATKIERDFRKFLTPKPAKEKKEPSDEYASTMKEVVRFLKLPKPSSGTEVRLKVKITSLYPAARGLCEAFNLTYGATLGMRIKIQEPGTHPVTEFKELYATGKRAEALLGKTFSEPVDIYARLQFSPKDVSSTLARFFGAHYMEYQGPYDEIQRWEPGEGKVILLLSKFVADAGK